MYIKILTHGKRKKKFFLFDLLLISLPSNVRVQKHCFCPFLNPVKPV